MLELPGFMDGALSWGTILFGYAAFIPAILAAASALGLLGALRLPWIFAAVIIAVSCTLGGERIGVGKGELIERGVWQAKVDEERKQRLAEKVAAQEALQKLEAAAEARERAAAEQAAREQEDLQAAIDDVLEENKALQNEATKPALPAISFAPVTQEACPVCPVCSATPSPGSCLGADVPPSILQRIR